MRLVTSVRTVHLPDGDELYAATLGAKAGRTVSVCIPCRDEAGTVGPLVETIRRTLMDTGAEPLVDEVLVIDDRSTDATAAVAAQAGATVVPIERVHAVHGPGRGKGNALWAALVASRGDVVVYLDGDITSFAADWVARLAAPLLRDQSIALVKAHAHRPTRMGGGGRTTELVARPLMSLYFPELSGLQQPLAGEYALRRSVAEALPFVTGWGVEVGLLIDILRRHGASAIAQVDVGIREHRHRPLESLSVQAAEVAATILGRAGVLHEAKPLLRRAGGSELELNLWERPPLSAARP